MFYQDLINFFLAWGRSRRWVWMFFIAAIPALLFLSALGLVIYGATLNRQDLVKRYMALVQADLVAGIAQVENNEKRWNAGSAAASEPRVFVPLRRILQLEYAVDEVVYLAGMAFVQQGRTAMAANLLRTIAPATQSGFPAAHAFLADYAIARWHGSDSQARALLADLQAAERGGIALSLEQLKNYVSLLVTYNRQQDALELLNAHKTDYPELNLLVLQISKVGKTDDNAAESALVAGRADFDKKREAGTATFQDVARAVQLEMLDNQIDQALRHAHYGFKLEPKNPEAARLVSNVLLAKHQSLVAQHSETKKASPKNPEANSADLDMRFLELAGNIDPANPQVAEEVAKAMASGQEITPKMKQLLEASLAGDAATGITHMVQASLKLAEGEQQAVLAELRKAYLKSPDSPKMMNNLAYAILKYDSDNLPEALQLIERALSSRGVTNSGRATMLDTLGEIRLFQGDDLAAIGLFEEAILHDANAIETRQKLADTYQKVGMPELAQGQRERIKQLSQP